MAQLGRDVTFLVDEFRSVFEPRGVEIVDYH